MSRLYCIDASIYIFRAYFSMPDRWYNDQGYPLNAVYGYARFLSDFLHETRPAYLMAAFDESLGSGYRHELYSDYKSNRVLPDEALAFQLAACRSLTEVLGVASYACETYEADDYIAASARIAARHPLPVTVVSRDKDLAQVLAGDEDEWWDYAADRRLRKQDWEAEQGLRAEQVADFLALTGDSIDAIPGVPGIGKVTARRLLNTFGDIDGILASLEKLADSGIRSPSRIQSALAEHREQLLLARQLTGLYDRAIRARSIKPFRYSPVDPETVGEFLLSIGCGERWVRGILRRLSASGEAV